MRTGRLLGLILACLPITVLSAPNADGVAVLKSAYPGVQVSKTSPTDWRIWGRDFGSGRNPRATAENFISQYFSLLFGPLPQNFGLLSSRQAMRGKFTVLQYGLTGTPASSAVLVLVVRNEANYPLVLASGNFASMEGPTHLASSDDLEAIHPAVPYPADWVRESILEIYVEGEEPRLAYRVLVDNRWLLDRVRRYVWVDVRTGTLLGERDLVYRLDLPGTVLGWATPGLYPHSFDNLPELRPIPGVAVEWQGRRTWSGYDGSFLLSGLPSGPLEVAANVLNAKWAKVITWAGSQEIQTVTATPPDPVLFELNPFQTQFSTAQVNAVLHCTLAHDFVKTYSPDFPGIDVPVTVNVNLSGRCTNTDYADGSMNFTRASQDCANTAYSTVIYHEYGHFAIDMAHPRAKRDYHEGMADLLSAFLTNDPQLFLDMLGPGKGPIRNLDTATERYPSKAQEHIAGQVIGGAFWKAKKHLAQRIGDSAALEVFRELWANSILLVPPAISPMVVIDLLVLDDNDTRVTNGTPHWESIRAGFAAHNLHAPELPLVNFDVTLPPQFEKPNRPHVATVMVSPGLSEPRMNTLALNLSVAGSGYVRIPIGSENPVQVPFPPQACGTVVRWFLSVDTASGLTAYWPSGGSLAPSLVVYSDRTETIFYDDFETDKGWTVQNIALTTGAWQRGTPWPTYYYDGSLAQPDGDYPYDEGTTCYVTGLGNPGDPPGASDVDGGPTILTSPRFDLSGANGVICFASWLFNEDNDDFLAVKISADDGHTWVTARQFLPGDYLLAGSGERRWMPTVFVAGDYVPPSDRMRLRFEIADNPNNSVTEAAVDAVKVIRFSSGASEVPLVAQVVTHGFFGDPTRIDLVLELRDPVSGLTQHSYAGKLAADRTFGILVPPGTYDLALKADRWLREIVHGISVSEGSGPVRFELRYIGDASNDNRINVGDLTLVLLAFGEPAEGPVNLDGVGLVDLEDVITVMAGYGRSGPD